jgi:hypothetical protein
MTKSNRLRWTGNVAHMGEMKNTCRILAGKPDRKDHMVDLITAGE